MTTKTNQKTNPEKEEAATAEHATLAEAYAAYRGELQPAERGAHNPFKDYNYATLADVYTASSELMAKYHLAVIQSTEWLADEGYLMITTRLIHSPSGEESVTQMPIICDYRDPQAVGKMITYMRRYSDMVARGVAPATDLDDDGEAAAQKTGNGKPRKQKSQAPELPEDEAKIYNAKNTEFLATCVLIIPRYSHVNAVKNALKKLEITAVPATKMERVRTYRMLRDYATQRDAEDAGADKPLPPVEEPPAEDDGGWGDVMEEAAHDQSNYRQEEA